ncbi:MAG: hypothetical protein U0326_14575 [Polyangiales bacterium]
MSLNELVDRLKAWEQGAPLPTTETLPFPRVPDAERLVLAFVRMGGESVPWGVAIGRPDGAPRVFTAPDPRNRDAHAELVRAFSAELLAHVGHPRYCDDGAAGNAVNERPFPTQALRLRQLWLPGATHVEMLHLLDYRYTLAATGDDASLKTMRAFGRAAGWLFRESTRPGQVRVHDATARLRGAWVFPSEPARQSHLGYLLAWLGEGSGAEREARARVAERCSVGVTLSPEFERDTLEPLVRAFHDATGALRDEAAKAIHAALSPELTARWTLTVQCLRALDADPRAQNPQLGPVLDLGAEECHFQYWRHETQGLREDLSPEERRSLGSHPETDFSPARAAARYFQHLHAYEVASNELVHGDRVLLERSLDAGDGFTGTVTAVGRENNARSGPVRWTIQCPPDESLRLREESKVCLVGARKRAGAIVSVEPRDDARVIVVELDGGLTKRAEPSVPDADDGAWVGREVTFLDRGAVGISQRKSMFVRSADGPGAWLTHAAPLPEPSPAGLVRPDLVELVKGLQ